MEKTGDLRKILSWVLAFAAVGAALPPLTLPAFADETAGGFTVTGGVRGTDYSYADNTLTIRDGTALTISGTTTSDKIAVNSGVSANVTLSGVSIDLSATGREDNSISGSTAFSVAANAAVNLTLKGVNTLKSGCYCAGLAVPQGASLNIDKSSTGSLSAAGGCSGAGIGGGLGGIHDVVYNANGHGNAPSPVRNVHRGSSVIQPSDPTTTGYSFGGWYTDASCSDGKKWDFSTGVMPNADLTLYAKWTLNNYTVNFVNDGKYASNAVISGNVSQTVPYLGHATSVCTIKSSSSDYAVAGWSYDYTASDGTEQSGTADGADGYASVAILGDVTFHAVIRRTPFISASIVNGKVSIAGLPGSSDTNAARENIAFADLPVAAGIAYFPGDNTVFELSSISLHDFQDTPSTLNLSGQTLKSGTFAFSTIDKNGSPNTVHVTVDLPTGTISTDKAIGTSLAFHTDYIPMKASYAVRHYKQNASGGYTLADTDTLTDVRAGSLAEYGTPKNYKGFSFDTPLTTYQDSGMDSPQSNAIAVKYDNTTYVNLYYISSSAIADGDGTGGTVSISGGTVSAAGGSTGAGIGGGLNGSGGAVTISGGSVKAVGDAAGGAKNIGRGAGGDDDGSLKNGGDKASVNVCLARAYLAKNADASGFSIDGCSYGMNGAKAFDDGCVYLYLPIKSGYSASWNGCRYSGDVKVSDGNFLRCTPTAEGASAAGTYGQNLSRMTPTGTVKDGAGIAVPGTWAFTGSGAADIYPAPDGTAAYTAVFTPANSSYFTGITKEIVPKMSCLSTDAAASLSGRAGKNGWYVGDVTVSAPDGYTIAASNAVHAPWGGSLTVASDMDGDCAYYLRQDGTGFITGVKNILIRRDTAKPTIENITYRENGSVITKVLDWLFGRKELDVAVSVADTASGADKIVCSLSPKDGASSTVEAAVKNGEAVITVNAEFVGKIGITAYDNAGNASAAAKVGKAAVEDVPPTLRFTDGAGAALKDGWYTSGAAITAEAADAGSGLKTVSYRADGGGRVVLYAQSTQVVSTTGAAITVLEGEHTYAVTASDNSGNSVTQSVTVKQDTAAPTLSGAKAENVGQSSASVGFTSDDEGSVYVLAQETEVQATTPDTVQIIADGAQQPMKAGGNTAMLENLKSGTDYTVYLAAKDKAGNATTGAALFVSLTTAPDPAPLDSAIAAAQKAEDGIKVLDSQPGAVPSGTKFTAAAVKTELDAAIAAAQNQVSVLKKAEDIRQAVNALNAAAEKFRSKIEVGTYTAPRRHTVVPAAPEEQPSSGKGDKPDAASGLGKSFSSDTTAPLCVNRNYQFRITSLNGKVPVFQISAPGVFHVVCAGNIGRDYFFRLIAVGQPGDHADVLVNGGSRLLTATVTNTTSPVSDTHGRLPVKKGQTYQFCVTADHRPRFAVGQPGLFAVAFVGRKGGCFYFKIKAEGEAGSMAGIYIESEKAVAVAVITD